MRDATFYKELSDRANASMKKDREALETKAIQDTMELPVFKTILVDIEQCAMMGLYRYKCNPIQLVRIGGFGHSLDLPIIELPDPFQILNIRKALISLGFTISEISPASEDTFIVSWQKESK